ncbi:MAG TPA: cytochrome C [Sulfurospirillum sp. UBA12182]|nr:MAG TPA: cytochrome C [Sulfurospirillum sp. UBA12182]
MIKKVFLFIKSKLFIFVMAGVFIGLLFSLGMYEGLHRTSNDKFCIVCHEMAPMVASYHSNVHGGAGKSGIKVACVTCHLPHDNVLNYIYTKAKNGVVEGAIHFFGNPDAIDWHKNRQRRDEFVVDEGCISCHTNYTTNPNISEKGIKMHKHYVSLQDTDKQIGCASCHVEIGHKGLRSMLNYYKPEYEFYDGKFDSKKEAVEKQLLETLK